MSVPDRGDALHGLVASFRAELGGLKLLCSLRAAGRAPPLPAAALAWPQLTGRGRCRHGHTRSQPRPERARGGAAGLRRRLSPPGSPCQRGCRRPSASLSALWPTPRRTYARSRTPCQRCCPGRAAGLSSTCVTPVVWSRRSGQCSRRYSSSSSMLASSQHTCLSICQPRPLPRQQTPRQRRAGRRAGRPRHLRQLPRPQGGTSPSGAGAAAAVGRPIPPRASWHAGSSPRRSSRGCRATRPAA